MSNVINFPNGQIRLEKTVPVTIKKSSSIFPWIIDVVWMLLAITWPILKWVLTIDCTYQFFRMLYFWDKVGVHAGWNFSLHFFVFTALIYFIAFHEPKFK